MDAIGCESAWLLVIGVMTRWKKIFMSRKAAAVAKVGATPGSKEAKMPGGTKGAQHAQSGQEFFKQRDKAMAPPKGKAADGLSTSSPNEGKKGKLPPIKKKN